MEQTIIKTFDCLRDNKNTVLVSLRTGEVVAVTSKGEIIHKDLFIGKPLYELDHYIERANKELFGITPLGALTITSKNLNVLL